MSHPPLDYYLTDEWSRARRVALDAAAWKCRACGGGDVLMVVHLSIERLGNESPTDLTVLCSPCQIATQPQRDK